MAALLEEASDLLDNDCADGALEKATEALEAFRSMGNTKAMGDAARIVVSALRLRQEPKEAYAIAKLELASFEDMGDRRGKACMLLSMAEVKYNRHGSKGRDEALSHASEAVRLFKEVDDGKMVGESLMILSNVHISRGTKTLDREEFLKAQKAAEECLSQFASINDARGQAGALHNLGMSYAYLDEHSSAIRSSRKALALWQEIGNKKNEALEQSCLSRWLLEHGDAESSKDVATSAQLLWEELICGKGYASQACSFRVVAMLQEGNVVEAKAIANEALDKACAAEDLSAEAQAWAMLFSCEMANQETEKALQSARKALSALRKGPRTDQAKLWEASFLQRLAKHYLKQKQLQDANECCDLALSLAREVGEQTEIANIIGLMSEVSTGQEDHEQAISKASEMRDMFADRGNIVGEGYACLEIANARAGKGDAQRAVASCRTALEYFEQGQDRPAQAEALFMMGQLQLHVEEFKAAMKTAAKGQDVQQQPESEPGQFRFVLLEVQAALGLAIETASPVDLDSALKCGQSALQLAYSISGDSKVCDAMYNLAQVFVVMCDIPRATTLVEQATAICEQTRDEGMGAYFKCLWAQLYLQQRKFGEAKESTQQAIEIFARLENEHGQKIGQDLLEKMRKK